MKKRFELTDSELKETEELLRSDIDKACRNVGDWKKIEKNAYISFDSVRTGVFRIFFPIVCTAALAAVVCITQLFSTDRMIETDARAAADEESEVFESVYLQDSEKPTESESGIIAISSDSGESSENGAYIGLSTLRYSSDESGVPISDRYSLSYKVFFPAIEGETKYGMIHTFVICGGEVTYDKGAVCSYSTLDEEETVENVRFKIDPETAALQGEEITVTVVSCFVRTGGKANYSSAAAVDTLKIKNKYFLGSVEEEAPSYVAQKPELVRLESLSDADEISAEEVGMVSPETYDFYKLSPGSSLPVSEYGFSIDDFKDNIGGSYKRPVCIVGVKKDGSKILISDLYCSPTGSQKTVAEE